MVEARSVGPSRSGDQFHYQWAARQCLGLLTGKNGLVAVAIEGASLDEGEPSVSAGDEVIDVGFYYGSEDINKATRIEYVQLKHSSKQANVEWTVSGLKKTIVGFSARFKELKATLGLDNLLDTVQFVFLTNRPIKTEVLEALSDRARGSTAPRHKQIDNYLKQYAKEAGGDTDSFFAVFSVEAGEPDLWEQRNLLSNDLNSYLSEPDTEAALQLKEVVTRRATEEGEGDRSVRLYDVLRALRVTEIDLLPAPSLITSEPAKVLPRSQKAEILATLLTAERPVVIHADGGVGKTTLAAHLASSMPTGSVALLYDCFGDGTYRQALKYRHRYSDALVQIANELSGQQLCLPLIPSSNTDNKQFMRAFVSRLNQAIDLLRASTPDASLCIIVDAADNAYMAATEIGERAFVQDLINTEMPEGVRLAFTCRSHRYDHLCAPVDAIKIELKPFSKAETAEHLRLKYTEVSDEEVEEFAFLSSNNPRVQALAIEGSPPISDVLKSLGPAPTTVEQAIGGLLATAIERLKAELGSTEADQIDLICKGLAVLRPLVPVSVLAQIAGVSESAVRTFATEFGRPLFLKDSGLHFMDEPAETWFRETYKPDSSSLDTFLAKLKPLAATSSYVAAALPQLLLSAGRLNELIELALSNENLPDINPIERRDVEIQRMLFALRACLQKSRHVAATKLALKLGGEVAGEARQNALIQHNTDIASILLSPDRVEEIVSRRTFRSSVVGFFHAYEAVLLAGKEDFIPEASSRLRMARESLIAWSKSPEDEGIDYADIAEFALATLKLRGPSKAARFLEGWSPNATVIATTKLVTARLADVGDYRGIDELAVHSDNVWVKLGVVIEAARIGHVLPISFMQHLMDILLDPELELIDEDDRSRLGGTLINGVRSAITIAIKCLPRKDLEWADGLRRYLPDDPPDHELHGFSDERITLIRAYALDAALRGRRLELVDLVPKDIRPNLGTPSGGSRDDQESLFKNVTGGVLHWFVLAAEVACGRQSPEIEKEINIALEASARASERDYYNYFNLDRVAATEWLQTLRDSPSVRQSQAKALFTWVESNTPSSRTTLTEICRIAGRTAGLENLSLRLSSLILDQLLSEPLEAENRIEGLKDLARAIFCVSKSEAAEYFGRAIEFASKIGEENFSRWAALLDLTDAVTVNPGYGRPRMAYRLSRIAELSCEYMGGDRHMDWDRLVNGLVGLCPSSSLAILSRWRDREFGYARELIPIAIYSLIDLGLLPSKAAVAMSGIESGWKSVNDIKVAIEEEADRQRKKTILLAAYRLLRIQQHDVSTWREITALANSLAITLPDLDRLLEAAERRNIRDSALPDPCTEVSENHKLNSGPDWDEIFSDLNLQDASELAVAQRSLSNVNGLSYALEFYKEGARRASLSDIGGFLKAIQPSKELCAYTLGRIFEQISEEGKKLLTVRSELKKSALNLATREPARVRYRGWGHEANLDALSREGLVTKKEIASAQLKGYLFRLDELTAEDFFHLVQPLTHHLSSEEAEEALNFGFDLLEEVLEDKDGDGPWKDSLVPPISCEESLAGYLWAGLARPATAERWEHTHCVRNCIELNWVPVLKAMAGRASLGSPAPFVDDGLLFYEWHARQWLCIALARGAMEQPSGAEYFLPFLECCVREKHIIIRHFASKTLKLLSETSQVPSDLLGIAQAVNQPLLPILDCERGMCRSADDDVVEENIPEDKYLFGIDIGPYWFQPLGRIFGLSQQSFEQRARAVMFGYMAPGVIHRKDDQRSIRGFFRNRNTSVSHGTMPSVENSLVYQSYHAMMFVAAQLLESKSLMRAYEGEGNPFNEWIEGKLLTRDDGRWLADRRDPEITAHTVLEVAPSSPSYCWQISKEYLDSQLYTDDGMTVLWGRSVTRNGGDETVSVKSVLVPSPYAPSYLCAMQTSPEPGEVYFPRESDSYDFEDDSAIGEFERARGLNYRAIGWVAENDYSLGLDKYDPWGGQVENPGPQPSQDILDALNAIGDEVSRSWKLPEGGRVRSESWAADTDRYEKQNVETGIRLSADEKFIQALLKAYPDMSLVICVTVRRRPPNGYSDGTEYHLYNYPYNRYYLIGQDGIIRTL